MRCIAVLTALLTSTLIMPACETIACKSASAPAAGPDLTITAAKVRYLADIEQLVFELTVAGTAGGTVVAAKGGLDGAPVLGYVFPTTLAATDVGFGAIEGIVALVAAVHPDFDDSPLWDENRDGNTGNDGGTWHTHWVVLGPDDRVPGGLAVKAAKPADILPATAPKMPMFMDSPGFPVLTKGPVLRIVVPAPRVTGKTGFRFDAVTAYMAVNAPGGDHAGPTKLPMLGVYKVYSILSGKLTLPFNVEQ